MTKGFDANEGYLNVALHILASQGWLNHEIIDEDDIQISLNEKSEIAFSLIPLYEDVVGLMQVSGKYHPRKFELEPFLFLEKIIEKFKNNYGINFSEENETKQLQDQVKNMNHASENQPDRSLIEVFGVI